MKLTDLSLKRLPAPERGQKLYYDDALTGLAVRVSQGGTRSFILQTGSDRRMITLGRYPVLSLAQARAEAKRMLAEFTLGRIRPQSITFDQAVSLFLDEKSRSKRGGTVREYRRLLTKHFPFKGQINQITPTWLQHRLNRLADVPSEYNHALTAGKVFFTWCLKRRYITDNPLFALAPNRMKPRTRLLTNEEIRALWRVQGIFADYIKLLFLTAQRRGELRYATLTADTFTIPSDISKNGRENTLPLTVQSKALFQTFPKFDWGKEKRKLDLVSGVKDWTLHDIRRTVATRMAELGVQPHIIERILNHVTGQVSGVAAIYNRASYLKEMREAFRLWENRLHSIVG